MHKILVYHSFINLEDVLEDLQNKVIAYVLIPSSDINNKSKSRLQSFVNNSHLGAGFNIANEDLEIRGAGEILGTKAIWSY